MTDLNAISMARGPGGSATRSPDAGPATPDSRQTAASKEFEVLFLTEMLAHAGIADQVKSLGGGFGEEMFADHLVEAYAREIARSSSFPNLLNLGSDLPDANGSEKP